MENNSFPKFNEFQTELTQDLIDSFPKEVIDEFWDYVNNVPFIQRLISPDRKRAKDLPKDEEGKIIVDLSNPHILEDMDYFREAAIHYQQHKCYTKLRVNSHPQSEFMKWFKREIWRCWYGMVREYDGEWIPGLMYFYLNYMPIIQTVIKRNKKGKRYGERRVDLPEVWEGVYWRFHYIDQARYGGLYNNFQGGLHGTEIASRGKSKSYAMASILANYFILGLNMEHTDKVKSLIVADNKEFLIKDGTLTKYRDCLEFLYKNTQFPSRELKTSLSDMHWISGDIDSEGNPVGSQNETLGVSIGDDPDKSRGKRSDFMGAEEFGSFNKFMEWWSTSMPNVQEGEIAFGFAFNIGTGGTEGSNFMGALAMINEPESKFIYGLPNIYDKGSSGKKKTVFFYPAFVNYKPYYNKDGVSDVVGAMLSELRQRHTIKYNSTDPLELTKRRAEFAFTLKDAIMRRDSTIYPVADLNDQINYLDANPSELQSMYVGRLDISEGEVKWVPDSSLNPIMQFPHKDNKLKGCVYIKTHPIKDSNGQIPWGRYISGADTIDTDGAETLSLFSGYILDLWTDDIVAEYTGREDLTDDSFEIYRRLLIYYNAEGNYESNKKGLFSHFSKYNSLHLLSDVLDFLKERNPQKVTYGNSSKGTVSSNPIKNMGRIMLRNYLLKPYESSRIEIIDGKEEEVSSSVPNLRRIKFRALLQELSQHNLDGNFDRHDALLMLMLLREDKLRMLGDDSFENRYNNIEKDYLGNDSFFTNNYPTDEDDDFKEQLRKLGYTI